MRFSRLAIILPLIFLVSCGLFNKKTVIKKGSGSSLEAADDLGGVSLNLDVKKYELKNGLRVLLLENKQLPIYSYYTFFDVGGRHESREKGTTGATHFLEHMMFKGAKKYGPGEFDTTIEGNGGSTNAYTNFDSTVYYQNMPSHTLNLMIDMEADRMQNLLLIKESFESERQVVLSERGFRYENSPRGKLYLGMMQAVFEGTPYGGSVIGDAKDVKSLTRDQMMDFFHKYYAPNNAIIVIVGDIDADKTIKEIKDKFGKIPFSKHIEPLKEEMDKPSRFTHRGRYKREVKLHGQSPTPMFMMAYKGEKLGTRKSFVMDILSSILGDGESSYLHQKYVKGKRPVLTSIGVGNYTLKHNGVFYLNGNLTSKTSLRSFKRDLQRDSRKFCQNAITERSLQKTKNQYLYSYYGDIQTNAGIASFLGLREMYYGDYSFYKKELDIYNSINAEEVKKVCHEVFDRGQNIFVSVWDKHPKSKKGKK